MCSSDLRRFGVPDPLQTTGDEKGEFVIPRPPHWGGYRRWVDSIELWVEGEGRIHDRARWTRELTPRADGFFGTGPWTSTRLQP